MNRSRKCEMAFSGKGTGLCLFLLCKASSMQDNRSNGLISTSHGDAHIIPSDCVGTDVSFDYEWYMFLRVATLVLN